MVSDTYASRTPRKALGCNDADGKQEYLYLICMYENSEPEIKAAEEAGELWRLTLTMIKLNVGKTGSNCRSLVEPIAEMMNALIDMKMPLAKIHALTSGYRCEHPLMGTGAKSCPDAIARELKKHIKPEAGE